MTENKRFELATEKRFVFVNDDKLMDLKTNEQLNKGIDFVDIVVDLLNELNTELEQSKTYNGKIYANHNREMRKIIEENKQLQKRIQELEIGENEIILKQETTINQLIKENEQLKREKERYKRLSEIRDENINNRILSLKEFINNCEDEKVKNILEDFFYSEVNEYDLAKENRELKNENEQLKKELKECKAVIDKKWSEYVEKEMNE